MITHVLTDSRKNWAMLM